MKKNLNFKKLFLIALIISLSISALIGIYILLFGEFRDTEIKILLTTLSIGAYSIAGLCCSALLEKDKFKTLVFSWIIISTLGFFLTINMIREILPLIINNNILLGKFTWIIAILAASFAHTCLLLLINIKKNLVNITLRATIVIIFIVAIMLSILIIREFNPQELFLRILGVIGILDALGTITTPILNKVYSIKK